MEIATAARNNKRCDLATNKATFDTLIVMHMACQHQIRQAARVVDGVLEEVSHVRTSRMMVIKGINWMVYTEDEGLIPGRCSKFIGKPLLLLRIYGNMFGHVAVCADNRHKGAFQREIDI